MQLITRKINLYKRSSLYREQLINNLILLAIVAVGLFIYGLVGTLELNTLVGK